MANLQQKAGVKPFLKWAGGKTQLLGEFEKRLPAEMREGGITKYVEPFIGGGAVFFSLNHHFSFSETCLCDANVELVLTYKAVKKSVRRLIAELETLESDYLSKDNEERESFYYTVRESFNRDVPWINCKKSGSDQVERAALIIFLNRTCYNGLFRLNQRGEFNVPFGRYKIRLS